uniref:DUF5641 domain-containing protein n=1 Tax=Wuchereria bancrofti TaxID=6293 RepID=A0AAF5RY31_WUCBA
MTWKNIVPKALWQGGIYKRLIGLTKNASKKELVTLTAEVEGIFNTRPLTYVNFDECVIIRPVDFILPNALLHLPMIKNDDTQEEFIPHKSDIRERLKRSSRKLLDRPINILYPLEVNDKENHLELNNKEGEFQEPIAVRTRSNTKRQSQSKGKEKYFCTMDIGLCQILKPQKIALHKKKCITNTSIVLWDVEQITRKCLYSEVAIFNAQIYENNFIIDELQTSFVFSKENKTFRSGNCNFTNPSLMNGDTLIDIVTKIANVRSRRNPNLALALLIGKLIMMETYQQDDNDPENTKLQYLFDMEQRTCENRNNLLLLIEWLSMDNPTLAANLLLQRNDVIAKRIDGKLLIAPCKPDSLNPKIIEIKGGLISKFEIDKVNAVLEILAQNQRMINPKFKRKINE